MEIENDKEESQMELKKKYLQIKAQYENAMKEENWEAVEELEDEYVELEVRFVETMLDTLKDKLGEKQHKTLKENWTNPKYTEKVVGLLLKLV